MVFCLTIGLDSLVLASYVSAVFVPRDRFRDWVRTLLGRQAVFMPNVVEGSVHWHRLGAEELESKEWSPDTGLRRIRACEPVKAFFFSPREQVGSFPERLEPGEAEQRILFGVKNCDLLPLRVHEKMFLEGEFKDPFYESRVANTVLVAADCPEPEESCFCNLVGRGPYVTQGADAAASVLDGGYLVEGLTERGEELLGLGSGFAPATEGQMREREASRKTAVAKLGETNPKPWSAQLPERVAARDSDQAFWDRHAATCVECFGCLFACPTCYCFLLYDRAREAGLERSKVWDACYMAAFARVGGGANPRAELRTRFANRFHCKFEHFKNRHGFFACSGCGRCFRVCMGKIDIRNILGEM